MRKPPSWRSPRLILNWSLESLFPIALARGKGLRRTRALALRCALPHHGPRLIAGAALRLPKEATLHHLPSKRASRPALSVAGATLLLPW